MLKTTRTVVKWFWGVTATCLIGLAVVVVVGRELAPQITHYKPEIEAYLSQAMSVDVSIAELSAEWDGLTPQVRVRGLVLRNLAGADIMTIDTAVAELGLLRSLLQWQMAWRNLELVRVNMGLRQNPDHSWSLIGLPPSLSNDAMAIDDPLDVFLTGRHIELRDANLHFEFLTGHSSQVNFPNLTMENSGNFHRLSSQVNIAASEESLRLVVEGQGDPRYYNNFVAEGYLRLDNFEVDKALAAFPGDLWEGLPEQEWRQGHQLNLEVWFDVLPGMEVQTRGRVDLGELPVSLSQEVKFPLSTGANFAGRWHDNGRWTLTLRDLLLDWGEVQSPPTDLVLHSSGFGQPINLQVAHMALAPWLSSLRRAEVIPAKFQAELDKLQPRGALENLLVTLGNSEGLSFRLQAELAQVAVESYMGAPQVAQLDGYIEATPEQGFFEVQSRNGFALHFPTVFEQPFHVPSAEGRVHWRLDHQRRAVRVYSDRLSVTGIAERAAGYFSLFVPYEFGSEPEQLIVQLGVENADLADYRNYLPHFMPAGLRQWMDASVGGGVVRRGGLVYRGGLTAKSQVHSAVQLYLDVEQGELQFHPQWPSIGQTAGELWLNDREVTAHLSEADFLNSRISQASVHAIPRFSQQGGLDIAVTGTAQGDAADALTLVEQTPLRDSLGPVFAGWNANGEITTAIDIQLPLQFATDGPSDFEAVPVPASEDQQQGYQQVAVTLQQVDVTMMPADLTFNQITGTVVYDSETGLDGRDLRARFLSQPIVAQLRTRQPLTGDLQPSTQKEVNVTASGEFPVSAFSRWLPVEATQLLTGSSRFQASLVMPLAGGGGDLTIDSQLQGLQVDLPPPFFKSAEQQRTMRLQMAVGESERPIRFAYGNFLQADLTLEKQTLASLAIGLDEEPRDLGSRLSVNGALHTFDIDAWREVLARWQPQSSLSGESEEAAAQDTGLAAGRLDQWLDSFAPRAELQIDTVSMGDFSLDDLRLTAKRASQGWQLSVSSPVVMGEVQWFDKQQQPMQVDLAHLHWPESEIEKPPRNPFLPPVVEDPFKDWDPRDIPAMDVQVADFSLAGDNFGSWSFELRPTGEGIVLRSLMIDLRGGRVVGSGDDSGAKLWWEKRDGEMLSRFDGRFTTEHMAEVLAQWDQPELVDSEAAYFDSVLSWEGSPAAISTLGVWGDVSLVMENGSFYQSDDQAGAGDALLQLISFLNFDSWVRRLRLDFSDLTRRGMPFDQVVGRLEFAKGLVIMNTPLVVNTPSGKFQVTGELDLWNNDVDAILVATLPVGGNLTLFTAVAAGLPAALGVYVVSKVFEKQMNKVASLRYRVTGDLSDPVFEFDKLFDDDVSPGN